MFLARKSSKSVGVFVDGPSSNVKLQEFLEEQDLYSVAGVAVFQFTAATTDGMVGGTA
jgi:hypothetical protein